MKIKVLRWGSNHWNQDNHTFISDIESKLSKMGLELNGYDIIYGKYNVIDKSLFMLAVVKYGIEFEMVS